MVCSIGNFLTRLNFIVTVNSTSISLAAFGYGDLATFGIFEFLPTLDSLLGGLFGGSTIEGSGRGGNSWLTTFAKVLWG
jgi:hypothetical protein